jgi:sugar phosphate isomerase/epimerase
MDLKLFKAAWGMPGDWDSRLHQIAEAGYIGVETMMPAVEDEERFKDLLEKYDLELILQVYTGCVENLKPYPDDAKNHITSFEDQVQRAATFKPILINSQSAKDSMPYESQLEFFENAIKIEKQISIPVAHETHRGRSMFTPWTTARLLHDLPELHIAADFSHWCNVCESLLPDQKENLSIAFQRSIHIHGRVGFEQGPQVPDYRAPEYENELNQHEQWWDEICKIHQSKGSSYLTFTPEFGPPGYMHTQPYTNQPVVDLWEICYAMGQRFRERFTQKYS